MNDQPNKKNIFKFWGHYNDDALFKGIWEMMLDGACSKFKSGSRVDIEDHTLQIHPHAFKLQFEYTNNEVEYESLVKGLCLAHHGGIKDLLVNHLGEVYNIQKRRMNSYANTVWDLIKGFYHFTITYIM